MAWFNAPAYRGMLMHTKVFGRYNGPEETMEQTGCYTEINVIDNYAPSAPVTVIVTGLDGSPASGATVEFKLYNYAEFYTVSRKTTDHEGQASLSAGLGDMLVWASHDGRFGLSKVSFGKDKTVGITLDKTPGDAIDLPLDIIPPPDGSITVSVTEEQKKENVRRLSGEDSIRNIYTSSFYTPEKAVALAAAVKLDAARIVRIMSASRGNWYELEHFLEHAADKATALALLEAVSAKDLRDTPSAVLEDHLRNTAPGDSSDPVFVNYLLNPRVANELLSPYKSRFAAGIPQDLRDALAADPQALSQWVSDNITVDDDLNPQRIPILPYGVWRARVADEHSRNIFYVALARSLGHPSRIEPVGGKVQRLSADRSRWIDVNFERPDAPPVAEGSVTAAYYPTRELPDPKYYSHFTIAKIRPDGTLRTLNFESGAQVDMGLGDTWSALLRRPLGMDEGHYILITGTRMARGNVLANITSFNVDHGRNTRLELRMRQDASDIQVLGSIDAEATFRLASDGSETSILNTSGRGYFAIGILAPGEEPTNHALRSLVSSASALEEWGRRIILLFPGQEELERFTPQEFEGLPSNVVYGIDHEGRISAMLASALNLSTPPRLPVFIIADTFGRVVFVSEGYTIGLAGRMLQTIPKL
jgi:hypothetical protein